MKKEEILPLLRITRVLRRILHNSGVGAPDQAQLYQSLQTAVTELTDQVDLHRKSPVGDHLYGALLELSNARERSRGNALPIQKWEEVKSSLTEVIGIISKTKADDYTTHLQFKIGTLSPEQVQEILKVEGNFLQAYLASDGNLDLEKIAGASVYALAELGKEADTYNAFN